MYRAAIAALLGASLLAAPALAFELTAGSLGLEKGQFVDQGVRSFDKAGLKGSAEFDVSPQFGLQGDLGIYDLGRTDGSATSVGLHGIYNYTPNTAFGAYVGLDNAKFDNLGRPAEDVGYYGVEIANRNGQLDTEVYIGGISDSQMKGTQMGLKGRVAINDFTGVSARYDTLRLTGPNASRLGVGGDISLGQTGTLYGEIGRAKMNSLGNENFLTLGAKVNFGHKPSTTFSQRGILEVLPGL